MHTSTHTGMVYTKGHRETSRSVGNSLAGSTQEGMQTTKIEALVRVIKVFNVGAGSTKDAITIGLRVCVCGCVLEREREGEGERERCRIKGSHNACDSLPCSCSILRPPYCVPAP